MKIFNDFIVSREKISRESIRVDDLYFTPNCENIKDRLDEIIKITDDNFPNIYDINRKTVAGLIHIFNGNPTNTKFYMAALSLTENRNKRFQIIHDTRIGAYIQLKDAVKKKEETPSEEKVETKVEEKVETPETKVETPTEKEETPETKVEEKPKEEEKVETPTEEKVETKVETPETPSEEKVETKVEEKVEIPAEEKPKEEEKVETKVEEKPKPTIKNKKQQKAIDDAKAEI